MVIETDRASSRASKVRGKSVATPNGKSKSVRNLTVRLGGRDGVSVKSDTQPKRMDFVV